MQLFSLSDFFFTLYPIKIKVNVRIPFTFWQAQTTYKSEMNLTSTRLSASIFAIFLVIGIYLPFLPTWLEGRGLTAQQVGMVFAVALWMRIPVGLGLAAITDATGRRKSVLVAVSLIIFLGFISFMFMDGYWALLFGWVVVGTLLTSTIPLTDNLVMMSIGERKADYGRIRLWGSVSFIAASILGGMYLQGRDSETILHLLIAGSLAIVVGALLAPSVRTAPRTTRKPALFDLLQDRPFVVFVLTAACLQASHAALYGFASIAWKAAGHSEGMIGLLWAEGVALEVLLFTFGSSLMARFRVWQVLLLASLAGILRWTVLGSTTDLYWLIAAQGLHALTFAGTHLAAVMYIARRIPPDRSASAQSLYDGLAMGFMFGIAMMLAGWVYGMNTTDAFYVMVVFSALGGIGAIALGKMQQVSAP